MQQNPALPQPEGAEARKVEMERLAATSDAAVEAASEEVTGLTPEQAAGSKRLHRIQERKAWADMRVFVIRWFGRGIVFFGFLLAVGCIVVACIWMKQQAADAAKLDSVVRAGFKFFVGGIAGFVAKSVLTTRDDEKD